MSTGERLAAPLPFDLDDTAEMPGLPEADSPTDNMPLPVLAGAAAAERTPRSSPHESADLNAQLATASAARRHFEASLSELTTKLRELEQHVQKKSEQLARHEREAADRERRIAELTRDLAARGEQLQLHGAERGALQLRLEGAQRELAELAPLREHYGQLQAELERGRGQHAAELARSRADLGELQRRVARQHETLQDAEGRRYLFDAMLREREQLLDERDARLHVLQEQAAAQQRDGDALRAQHAAEFEAQLSLRVAQQRTLEQRLEEQLRQWQQREQALNASAAGVAAGVAELETQLAQARQERDAALGTGVDLQQRVTALEAESADHGEFVRTLQEQLQAASATNDTLRGDLAAAEDMIRTAEQELQQREARLARLESGELALRTRLEAVDRSLDECNALIASMEATVAASSAAPYSHQSGLGPPGSPAVLGQRLLVCTEGNTGIVHVLGRRTTVGRTPDNDMRIEADFISRHHAVVLVTAAGTIVEDLNSTNGVFVNNVRIARRELREGDLLTFGKTSFRYLLKPAND